MTHVMGGEQALSHPTPLPDVSLEVFVPAPTWLAPTVFVRA